MAPKPEFKAGRIDGNRHGCDGREGVVECPAAGQASLPYPARNARYGILPAAGRSGVM